MAYPAYDYVLKCSHTFNVLDTRGAIGVTERQAYFGRMRDLARRVAEVYLDKRQWLEFPWLDEPEERRGTAVRGPGGMGMVEARLRKTGTPEVPLYPENSASLLFEIGTEELPAADLDAALDQLRQRVPGLLEDLRLKHGEVCVLGTPRRLVVTVADSEPRQEDLEMAVKGPPPFYETYNFFIPCASNGWYQKYFVTLSVAKGLYHEERDSSVASLLLSDIRIK